MDTKKIEELAELSDSTSRQMYYRMADGPNRDALRNEVKQIIASFVRDYMSLLESTKLNFKSTLQYLESNTPYLLNQIGKITDEHGSEFIDTVRQSLQTELQKNADVLSDEKASDEEKAEGVKRHSSEKNAEIEEQKDLEQKANTYSTTPKFTDMLTDFSNDIKSQASRIADSHGYPYSSIDERTGELTYEARKLIENTSVKFNNTLHVHTQAMYSTYLELNEEYERASADIMQLDKTEEKSVSEVEAKNPNNLSELPDPFALSPEELAEYNKKLEASRKRMEEEKQNQGQNQIVEQEDKNPFEEFFL